MPQENYTKLPLCQLHLDPENPRLPRARDSARASADPLSDFLKRYNLLELARSIADKGFTPSYAEALLVIKHPSKADHYVVVEGNRRLAALKLLTSAEYRQTARATTAEWIALAATASARRLDPVPAVVYPDRHTLEDYLGFRHITGPRPWRPEAKARYIAQLLGHDKNIDEVARRIGSNRRTVRRFAEAHAIYTQALDEGIAMAQAEQGFGVFYNALDQEGVRQFLHLGRQVDIAGLPQSPVSPDHLEDLRELLALLFGDPSQNIDPVITESRELRKLGKVLANSTACANLLRSRDLASAWRISGGGRDALIGVLNEIHYQLASVNGQANEYALDDAIRQSVQRVCTLAQETAVRYGLAKE